jgi:hypothetical protein
MVAQCQPRATLTSYPGEQAILHTSLGLEGNNLTASHLRITGIASGCGRTCPGSPSRAPTT